MTILITGSEGYVGTALQSRLRSVYKDCDLIQVDRKLNVEVNSITDLQKVDCIIHLAAQPSVFSSNLNQVVSDNFRSFEYICDLAKLYKVPFIYASSAVAYDKNISSIYGESKKANELYAKETYPKAIGLRFHNIYSGNPRKDTIFYKLLTESSVTLNNNGLIYRHFTYLPDIIDAILYVLNNYDLLEGGVYNVLNPIENSILDLANNIKLYRPELKINLIPDLMGRDTVYQYVDTNLNTVPIDYKNIQDGICDIFKN